MGEGQVGFAGSFVRGDGDRGSWSPWLPCRGFDEGVWGIDAASSVASGGLRSFEFPSPSGGGIQQVGLSYRVAGSIGGQLDTPCDTYRSGILPSLRRLSLTSVTYTFADDRGCSADICQES